MTKKNELDLFLETCDCTFFNDSLLVISALLSKRELLNRKAVAETIESISHEKNSIKNAASVLISKISPTQTLIRITVEEGIDTIKITTKLTALEICTFLKRSKGMEDFAIRISSSIEKIETSSLILQQQEIWTTIQNMPRHCIK